MPDAVFALQSGALNNTDRTSENYTSEPFVLVQYYNLQTKKYEMKAYKVQISDSGTTDVDVADKDENGKARDFAYEFTYRMKAGQTVVAPYPLNDVIGANKLREISGQNGNPKVQTYWEDRNGIPWAISGDEGAKVTSRFWYPMQAGFWHEEAKVGEVIPFGYSKAVSEGSDDPTVSRHEITYLVEWPNNIPELRIGETLTFSGGEQKKDDPSADGLPGALGWASAEIVFDSLNKSADATVTATDTGYSARISPVLREIKVSLPLSDFPDDMKPATKRTEVKNGVWYFAEAHAGLKQRVYYNPDMGKLVLRGFVNDKTVGDTSLQAAPPADYILQPNILTHDDLNNLLALNSVTDPLKNAFARLYALSQQPTYSGYEILGEDGKSGIVPNKYGTNANGQTKTQPSYHVGLSRFLRGVDNRLLTVSKADFTEIGLKNKLPNDQLPKGLNISDLELIDPANAYEEAIGVSGGVFEALHTASSTLNDATDKLKKLTAETEKARKAYQEDEAGKYADTDEIYTHKEMYEPECKQLGDRMYVYNTNNGNSAGNYYACQRRHLEAYKAYVKWGEAQSAEKTHKEGAYATAKTAYEQAFKSAKATEQSIQSVTAPEKSQLPYGVTIEDLETLNNLKAGEKLVRIKAHKGYIPASQLGSGLALITNPNLLDPDSDATKNFKGGYVVIAENNDPTVSGNTVSLHIVKINDKPYRGMIKTVLSDNVFDEKIALRHTGDFGGNVENLFFDWRYVETAKLNSDLKLTGNSKGYKPPTTDPDPSCPVTPSNIPASSAQWKPFVDERPGNKKGLGWNELTFGNKAGKDVLVDNSFMVRYIHKDCLNDGELKTKDDGDDYANCKWSGWTGAANNYPCSAPPEYQPQLVTGWVKRVTENVNQYDARINDFSTDGAPATYVSMIQQAGQMYQGDVALNPDKDVIENLGLIELYQTVLNRASGLSIDADQTSVGVTQALQNAASRITQFYTLLGNEAYSDALDPTIGFASNSKEYGTLAPTIFTFQNQLSSLGEEELTLLRGRPEKGASPAYNRLLWNFTNGDGEAAYALSYNITDVDKNGEINEADARVMYPQGHGDAWGNYMSALQTYYDLLRHPMFTWESRAESYQIEGVTLGVDYLDERRFAEAAAYKAKVGAEIVTQTYREQYVEDPNGQWQGYKDTDATRAWGVDGWARRAHQGAYYDWVTAAALIPAKSKKSGIQKIDRTTVAELQEISSEGIKVLTELAQIDNGLNPLGLLPDVVPFDISPSEGTTQFEQVLARAESAIDNAMNVFDYANDLKHRIRKVADTQEEFKEEVNKQDREYRNRLIEIFGTPYEGTIGAGKAYPEGYAGPDVKFYQYIDVAEISDKTLPQQNDILKAYLNKFGAEEYAVNTAAVAAGDIDNQTVKLFKQYYGSDFPSGFTSSLDAPGPEVVEYPLSSGSYSFSAPKHWGKRTSQGQLQDALMDIVKADVDVRLAAKTYNGLVDDLRRIEREIKARTELKDGLIKIQDSSLNYIADMNDQIRAFERTSGIMDHMMGMTDDITTTLQESLPKAVGFSNDVGAPGRGWAGAAQIVVKAGLGITKLAADQNISINEDLKEQQAYKDEKKIITAEYGYDIKQQMLEIDGLMDEEPEHRLKLFKARENLRQAAEKFPAILGKGLRLMDERTAFNKKVAAKTHGKRYQDMAFRLNRTEASQKYRAAFDMAAKYVYLAAKAYDYETNLSETHSASALPLLSEIIQARSLGQFFGGEAVVGMGGLADVLARMKANYSVLKTQMGINNPQLETEPFSLRSELFRLRDNEQAFNQAFAALNAGRKTAISLDYEAFTEATDAQLMEKGLTSDEVEQLRIDSDSGASWRRVLRKHYVDDLWTDLPQFRTHMRPFAAEDNGKQPALVIPFSTNIISGQNFFGWPLSANDHAYDPSQFATRIRSVGIFIKGKDGGYNYDSLGLAATPRAYLVPVGQDVMYVPDSYELDTREWDVKDQKIPVPLPTGQSDLESGDWMPLNALDGPDGQIRRHSQMRVYNDSDGVVDASELNGDTRLYGRSVWNSQWLLVIPGAGLLSDATEGLDTLIDGNVIPGGTRKDRDGNGIDDIKLTFKTYAYSGN